MKPEETQLYWMDKAKDYAENKFTSSTIPWKEEWQKDALYVAYLHGVQDALKMRIID